MMVDLFLDVAKHSADVVILGGGMVGSTLACAMAGSPYFAGKKIWLLEGAVKKQFTLSDKFR
jgi:2-polyprenyl-6-methoxyphenol hydroxylase-like FAD-dependent oxidoreductase